MRIKHTIIVLAFLPSIIFAQELKTVPKKSHLQKIACDCDSSISLIVTPTTHYGPTIDTSGFGNTQEITLKDKFSKYYFEEEHNTAWYLLTMKLSGELKFNIIPSDTTNDYDFLLFKYTDTTFCNEFKKKKLIPIRTNISRLKLRSKGITGLSEKAKNEFAIQGNGDNFSKTINVVANEKYMLVLDNYTNKGKGHKIIFDYLKVVQIAGVVLDDEKKPIKAELTLTDVLGNIVYKTESNAKDGSYKFSSQLSLGQNYTLNIYNDSCFFKTIDIKPAAAAKYYTNIKTELPKLRGGKKYKIGNLNFYGGSSDIVPASEPSLRSLAKLLKKNKKIEIRIEGHVNNPLLPEQSKRKIVDIPMHQFLSEERANTVKNYLIKENLDPNRLTTIGLGSTQMVYPYASTEAEMHQNRRVEIMILKMD